MITVYYINVCHSVLTCFKSSATEVFQRKIVSLTVCNVTSVNSLETTQAVCALEAPLMNTEQYALNCRLTDSNAAEAGPTVL